MTPQLVVIQINWINKYYTQIFNSILEKNIRKYYLADQNIFSINRSSENLFCEYFTVWYVNILFNAISRFFVFVFAYAVWFTIFMWKYIVKYKYQNQIL